jgi:hypothetical protein
MSDTPITDREKCRGTLVQYVFDSGATTAEYVPAEVARQLERENVELRARVEAAESAARRFADQLNRERESAQMDKEWAVHDATSKLQ